MPRSDRSNAISRIPIAAAAASAVAETERASSVLRLDDFVLSYPDHREDARNTRTLAREFDSPSGLSPLKVNKISVNNNSHFTIQYHTTAYIHVRSKTDCYPVLSSARNRKRWFSKSKKRKTDALRRSGYSKCALSQSGGRKKVERIGEMGRF